MLFVITAIVTLLAITTFHLGLYDWPQFLYSDTLTEKDIFAIVATSTSSNIGGNIVRMMDGIEKGVLSSMNGEVALAKGANVYIPNDTEYEKIGIGIFLDNPAEVKEPRWAAGFLLSDTSLKSSLTKIQTASGIAESIKTVKIPRKQVISGRIPWRSWLTPIISPMLHWSRAFKIYENYKDRKAPGEPIAVEMYVESNKAGFQNIDYVILMGDTKSVQKELFP